MLDILVLYYLVSFIQTSKSTSGRMRFGSATRTSYINNSKSTLHRSSVISNSYSDAVEMTVDTKELIEKVDLSHAREMEVADDDFSYTMNIMEEDETDIQTHI